MTIRLVCAATVMLAVVGCATGVAQAQSYPDKPIHIISGTQVGTLGSVQQFTGWFATIGSGYLGDRFTRLTGAMLGLSLFFTASALLVLGLALPFLERSDSPRGRVGAVRAGRVGVYARLAQRPQLAQALLLLVPQVKLGGEIVVWCHTLLSTGFFLAPGRFSTCL